MDLPDEIRKTSEPQSSDPEVGYGALVRLAGPISASRVGQVLMGAVDTVIAGTLGPEALAALALAATAYFTCFLFSMGTLLGIEPVAAKAFGARDTEGCRAALRSGRWMALGLAPVVVLMCQCAAPLLGWMGHEETMIRDTSEYLGILSLHAFPYLLYLLHVSYVAAVGNPRPFVAITAFLNVVNGLLGYGLAHGIGILPEMGARGIALSTVTCATIGMVAAMALLRWSPSLRKFDAPWRGPDREVLRKAARIGLPVGVQYLLEGAGFGAVTLLMGLYGATVLAAHQVGINVVSLTFTAALGISTAGSVLVGRARGAGRAELVRRAGRVSVISGFCFAGAAGLSIAALRREIAGLYTEDAAVIEMAVSFLLVGALFQVADTLQAIGFGLLRGMEDTRVPMVLNVVGYFVLALPAGYFLAGPGEGDPRVWWWALGGALLVIACGLLARFWVLSARLTRRG